MGKIKKEWWEKIFPYPSFNLRFGCILTVVLVCFFVFTYILLGYSELTQSASDKIATLNLIIQGATLVLGIFAAYYALRQLVETRFTGLDAAGMQELRNKNYVRAFDKWKEAFYIKPETPVFLNMCETLLLIGDYELFDQNTKMLEQGEVLQELVKEVSDQQILLYLKSIRHLLVKNQGEAEKYIAESLKLAKKNTLLSPRWNFGDVRTSIPFANLQGECRQMSENLILYLSNEMLPTRKADFENGNFASVMEEPGQNLLQTTLT